MSLHENDLEQRVLDLEKNIRRLYKLIEFHKGKVPLKYIKAFAKTGEEEYFTCKEKFADPLPKFFKLGLDGINPGLSLIDIPKDPAKLSEAKERMLKIKEQIDMNERQKELKEFLNSRSPYQKFVQYKWYDAKDFPPSKELERIIVLTDENEVTIVEYHHDQWFLLEEKYAATFSQNAEFTKWMLIPDSLT